MVTYFNRNLEDMKGYTGLTWGTSRHGEWANRAAWGARRKAGLELQGRADLT